MKRAKPKTEVKLDLAALAGGFIIVVCSLYGLKENNLLAVLIMCIGAYLIWRS